MPILAIGRDQRGFTLIELMAVIAIIALATSAVVLSLPNGGTSRDDAERIAARVITARDTAISTMHPMALVTDAQGYAFEERRGGQWVHAGKHFAWPKANVSFETGRLVFDNVGATDRPWTLKLTDKGGTTGVSINEAGDVRVTP